MKCTKFFVLLSLTLLVQQITTAQTSGWTLLASPNPTSLNYLYGTAAVSPSNVWAVGYDWNSTTHLQKTLIEHWNGLNWAVIASPNPGTSTTCGSGYAGGNILSAVSASSAADVWAVGQMCQYQTRTLVEHWNGSQWAVLPSPNPANADDAMLAGVAALAPNNVWAVGNYQLAGQYEWETLIEHWNGSAWSIVPSPSSSHGQKSFLNAVAAVSASNIWAVGYSEDTQLAPYDLPLIEHYNGSAWSIVTSPYPAPSQYNSLYAVAAVSATDIWASGYANENTLGQNGTALMLHWNGTKWNLVSNPIAGYVTTLYGLAPVSSTNVWAAGYTYNGSNLYAPLTEHWNGTNWSVVKPPDPGAVAQLFGIATVNGSVWAVGAYSASPLVSGWMQSPKTLAMKR